MNYKELKEYIDSIAIDSMLNKTTCFGNISKEKNRYHLLLDELYRDYGNGDIHFVSSPGRVEIGGNHTDHQHGHVLAATISFDDVCAFKKSEDTKIVFNDHTLGRIEVDIHDTSFIESEINTSKAIIRGVANRLKELGYKVGGFRAVCDSNVPIGASVSSSACFEVMIVEIFSVLYNNSSIKTLDKALIAQYSENKYFNKASGLLDQLTIATGGLVTIDFKDSTNPLIDYFDFSFDDCGYMFYIINTKGKHIDLSDEYSAIPYENKTIANLLNKEYLADTSINDFIDNIKYLRESANNDRALLRSIHFYNEDKRVVKQKEAIENKDIETLLKLIKESGMSSYMYLQNVYLSSNTKVQNLSLGLALSDIILDGRGAFRMQGGGFEGTFLAIVPNDLKHKYIKIISDLYGNDSILKVKIRKIGTTLIA